MYYLDRMKIYLKYHIPFKKISIILIYHFEKASRTIAPPQLCPRQSNPLLGL